MVADHLETWLSLQLLATLLSGARAFSQRGQRLNELTKTRPCKSMP